MAEIECLQRKEKLEKEAEWLKRCCDQKMEICNISTLKKNVLDKSPEPQWFKNGFDPIEFPFSRLLQDFHHNPSENVRKFHEIRDFVDSIFEEARKRERVEPRKCFKHQPRALRSGRKVPVSCCNHYKDSLTLFDWLVEEGRWWRGIEFVDDSGIPRSDVDATRALSNEDAGRYWPPYGHANRRRPIKMVSILADEGDMTRDCNAALLRKACAAARRSVGWDVLQLKEFNNEEQYILQWRKYRGENKADVFVTRMHQVFGYDMEPLHQKLMLSFEELRQHHGFELEFPDLIAPAAGLLMVGRMVSLRFLTQISSMVEAILNCHAAEQACNVVPYGFTPSAAQPLPAFIPSYPLLLRLRNQASHARYVVFDHGGLKEALKELQRDKSELQSTRRDLLLEHFFPDFPVKRVFVIGDQILVREKPPVLQTTYTDHYCRETLIALAKKVNGVYVELEKKYNSFGYVTFTSDAADMKNPLKPSEVAKAVPCKDDVLLLTAKVISKQMNHLKIFRFDAIPNPEGFGYYLIKFVILPIMLYDGVPDADERVFNVIQSRSTRRAFRKDMRRQNPLQIMEMALWTVPGWKQAGLTLGDLKMQKINPWKARFRVALSGGKKFIREADEPDADFSHVHPRACLVRFYRIIPPRRWLMDEAAFANMVDDVHRVGLGPAYGDVIDAVYFGAKRVVAKTRSWIHGWSLKQLLTDDRVLPHRLEKVFRKVGDSLARFHLLVENPCFRERHISESDYSLPEAKTFYLFEVWRRDALMAVSCSTTNKRLEKTKTKAKLKEWEWLFGILWTSVADIEFLKRICCRTVKMHESRRLVWGYHDLHAANIIVEEDEPWDIEEVEKDPDDDDPIGLHLRTRLKRLFDKGPKSVQFGQADFAAPGFAVFDIASIIVSLEDIRLRQEETGAPAFTFDVLHDAVQWMVEAYVRRTQVTDDARRAAWGDPAGAAAPGRHPPVDYVARKMIVDAWVFVPLAALMKAFDYFYDACNADDEVEDDEADSGDVSGGVEGILQAAKNHLIIFDHSLRKLTRALIAYKENMLSGRGETSMNIRV